MIAEIYREEEEGHQENLAVFEVDLDGKYIYEDITIEQNGPSGYKIYLDRGSEDHEPVYCEVPHVHTLLAFLEKLTNKRPVFTSTSDA